MTQTPANILHLNLPVTDLEKSLAFYIDGLGFRYVQHLRRGKSFSSSTYSHIGVDTGFVREGYGAEV